MESKNDEPIAAESRMVLTRELEIEFRKCWSKDTKFWLHRRNKLKRSTE
jgi:hypothetical protein